MTATAEHNHGIRHAHYHGHKQAAADIAVACRNWLDSLNPEQKAKATFHYLDGERQFWYYPPMNRHGLPLRDMNDEQRNLAFAIMESSLESQAYQQARAIIEHELILGPLEEEGCNLIRVQSATPRVYVLDGSFGKPILSARNLGE